VQFFGFFFPLPSYYPPPFGQFLFCYFFFWRRLCRRCRNFHPMTSFLRVFRRSFESPEAFWSPFSPSCDFLPPTRTTPFPRLEGLAFPLHQAFHATHRFEQAIASSLYWGPLSVLLSFLSFPKFPRRVPTTPLLSSLNTMSNFPLSDNVWAGPHLSCIGVNVARDIVPFSRMKLN